MVDSCKTFEFVLEPSLKYDDQSKVRELLHGFVKQLISCLFCGETEVIYDDGDRFRGLYVGHESSSCSAVRHDDPRMPNYDIFESIFGEVSEDDDELQLKRSKQYMGFIEAYAAALATKLWNERSTGGRK